VLVRETAHEEDQENAAAASLQDEEMSDGESDCSNEEPPEIGFDQFGRLVVPDLPPVALDFCFRSFEAVVHMDDRLVDDCKTVFTARETEKDQEYSSGETFFVRADTEPKSALERLAMDIFMFHAGSQVYDKNKSGAEWWTLVLDDDSDVTVHWDKDYGLEESWCVNVCPHLSTVTYLAAAGGATCVLEKRAPPRPVDPISGPCGPQVHASKPKVGKHISFDGRWLHLATADFLPLFGDAPEEKGQRVTFLVNLWFNHIPKDAQELGEEVREKLNIKSTQQLWRKPEIEGHVTSQPATKSQTLEYTFGDQERLHKLSIGIPEASFQNASSSLTLTFGEGDIPVISLVTGS